MLALSSNGTKTLSTSKSLLPVPRIPVVCHTSINLTFQGGTSTTRISSWPSRRRFGSPSGLWLKLVSPCFPSKSEFLKNEKLNIFGQGTRALEHRLGIL